MRPLTAFSVLLTLSWFALFPGCGQRAGQHSQTTLERINREGVVRVGYANEAPYAYLDSQADSLTGEAPEIARVVLGRMGVKRIEGVLTEFGALIPGLKAGRFDLIAAGMYITPERCAEVSFSNPTYGIGEALVVRAGNPLGLHSYEDVARQPKVRLGVVGGTAERGYARALGITDKRLTVYPDAPSALAGVEAGRVDAYTGTSLTVQDLLDKARNPALERVKPFADPIINGKPVRGYGAFGFRREDRALLKTFNQHLAAFIGTPAHLELVRPFGFTETELPGSITAEALCARPLLPDKGPD
ncbi:MAG: ectoine/hydroxyectoine ABC transporter substrate-binding protein EhuB [Candidatus Latescibacteria bacterium]|nr:ectoine/hydroxyectoine ABC transporter substrate-binding protein EhuB [Candidatus Latescibacterota bacterium]